MSGNQQEPPSGKDIPQEHQIGPRKPSIFPLNEDSKLFKGLFGSSTTSNVMDDYVEYLDILDWKQNLILYGPPGTGKTYHAKKIADELIKNNVQPTWKMCALKILFDNGGKPLPADEIFERITKQKLRDTKGVTPEETVRREINEDINHNTDTPFAKPTRGEYGLELPMTFEKAAFTMLSCSDEPKHYQDMTAYLLDREMIDTKGQTPAATLLAVMTHDINKSPDPTFVQTDPGTYTVKHTLTAANLFKEEITFHQSYSYEEFIEGIKAKVVEDKSDPGNVRRYVDYKVEPGIFKTFCDVAKNDPNKNNKYVIIIDEINRGNISKIFGEVITVIEKDKRDTVVKLPYSRDTFSIPKNVFVIGTMNTADRSIAHIDTALARRFARDEFMPNSTVLKKEDGSWAEVKGIILKDVLDKINDNILAQDADMKDQQIGHSYLMNENGYGIDNISELRRAFVYDILPRLREFSFVYEIDLEYILGGKFIDWATSNIIPELKKAMVDKGTNHADDRFLKELNDFMNPKKEEPKKDNGKTENTDV